MAYNESGDIQPGFSNQYDLGGYTFQAISAYDSERDVTEVYAYCRLDTEELHKSAIQTIGIPGEVILDSWYVNTNDTTADVYAVVRVPISGGTEHTSDLDVNPATMPIETYSYIEWVGAQPEHGNMYAEGPITAFVKPDPGNWILVVGASATPGGTFKTSRIGNPAYDYIVNMEHQFTYKNKTVYYGEMRQHPCFSLVGQAVPTDGSWPHGGHVAWTMIYGTPVDPEREAKTILVGRFAIDTRDADVGNWDVPGDYNPDPTTTLHLTVTGALSGRHNDPLNENADYSYTPADQNSVPNYGCGGDGGHGGGGGAGSSTVIINKFATSKANYKELVSLARRHGYGSGGGKGGKGGDGCILVYY